MTSAFVIIMAFMNCVNGILQVVCMKNVLLQESHLKSLWPSTVGLKDTQGKKSLKGNAVENIYIGLVGMPKHQIEKNSSRESKVPT